MLNDALKDYYENLALEAVLDFAKEEGIRLRRGDFWLFDNQQDRRDFMDCKGEYSGKEKKGRGWLGILQFQPCRWCFFGKARGG